MGKPSAPRAPDPYKVADAQAQTNQKAAEDQIKLNSIDQYNPFGSSTYQRDANGMPISQTTSFSPQVQGLFDSQIGAQGGISDAIMGHLGNLPTGGFDPSSINTDDIAQKSYDQRVSLLQPQFDQQSKNLDVRLAERGLPIGSEAYGDEMNRFDTARNDALSSAARQATLDAGAEQSRQYGQALSTYQTPYNTLSSLMGNSSQLGTPSFQNTPSAGIAAPDLEGGVWNKYKADQQAYQDGQGNLMSGLLGAGKLGLSAYSAGLFSDERLKEDIEPVGQLNDGQTVYRYRYKGHPAMHIGLMAQEVEQIHPEAVGEAMGFKTVDYAKATESARAAQ